MPGVRHCNVLQINRLTWQIGLQPLSKLLQNLFDIASGLCKTKPALEAVGSNIETF